MADFSEIMAAKKRAMMLDDIQNPSGKSLPGTQGVELTESPKAEVSTPDLSSGLSAAGNIAGLMSGGGSGLGSGLSGAASGASLSSALGGSAAIGAGLGAGIGVIGAIAGNKAKRKAAARQIEANKWQAIAGIQQQQGQQEAAILNNMIGGLRSAMLRG